MGRKFSLRSWHRLPGHSIILLARRALCGALVVGILPAASARAEKKFDEYFEIPLVINVLKGVPEAKASKNQIDNAVKTLNDIFNDGAPNQTGIHFHIAGDI